MKPSQKLNLRLCHPERPNLRGSRTDPRLNVVGQVCPSPLLRWSSKDKTSKLCKKQAFTLIEILVAMTVFVSAMSIVAAITVSSTKEISRALATKKLAGYARDVNEKLSDEMRITTSIEIWNSGNTVILHQGNTTKTLKLEEILDAPQYKRLTLDDQPLLPSDVRISGISVNNTAPWKFNIAPGTNGQPSYTGRTLQVRLRFSSEKDNKKTMDYETMLTARN